MSGSTFPLGGVPPAVSQPAAQPAPNALLLAHPLMQSRGPLPPRHTMTSGMSPPLSQVPQSPLPPRLTGTPHGAPIPAPGGLPGLVVRVGPPGADAAQAHLRAGHSPDALVEAAANSLAQSAMVNGQLDPARYEAWVNGRLQFLAHIPGAAELFGSVEAAQRTIQAVMAHSGAAGAQRQLPEPAQPLPSRQFAVRRGDLSPAASAAASYVTRPNALLPR